MPAASVKNRDFSHVRFDVSCNIIKKAALASIIVFSCAAFFESSPSIVFDAHEYDFGPVPENSVQSCVFIFRNKGAKLLVIDKVGAG